MVIGPAPPFSTARDPGGSNGEVRRPTQTIALLALAACQPGSFGSFDPVMGGGVARAEGEHGAVAAAVDAGALALRVSGGWASERGQTLYVRYRNKGAAPVSVALGGFGIRHRLGPAELSSVVDITGQDYGDQRTDNDDAKPVYSYERNGDAVPSVTVAPGRERLLMIGFTTFPNEGDARVGAGDRVSIAVPVVGGALRLPFECEGSSWFS